jgi:WD40 repeat protein
VRGELEFFSPELKTSAGVGIEFGAYVLEEQIAHGGMGVVYRARQVSLDRMVAIKLLLLGRYSSAESIERFRREAQSIAALRHPGIVAVHEVGEHDGQHYIAMEYVDGRTLSDMLLDGPLAPERAAEITRDVARAVHYAHERGVLHRDLKPSNVLLDTFGLARIMDFGLAKKLDGSTDLTVTGQMIGTPNYLSPEQAAGRHPEVGPTSDVYAIGALLYELITGRPPFMANSLQETLLRIRDCEPVSPNVLNPAIHRDLDTICLKCLRKQPSRRYPTANALARDLELWLHHSPIEARRIGALERVWLWCKRNPRQALMALALMLAVVAGFAGVFSQWRRAENNRVRAEKQELVARKRAYTSDMNTVQHALAAHNLGRALELLDLHRPGEGELDLRDWEWRYLWQLSRSEEHATLCQRSNSVSTLTVSEDGRWLALGDYMGGGLVIWDLPARQKVDEFACGDGEVRALFSPAGTLLAASFERTRGTSNAVFGVRFWNVTTREVAGELLLDGPCRGLAFSKDGRRLLTSTVDPEHALTLWKIGPAVPKASPSGKSALFEFQKTATFPARQFRGVGSPFAANHDLSLAAYRDLTGFGVHLLDLTTGKERWAVRAADEYVLSLAFSPDGKVLACGPGYIESAIRLLDVSTGRELGRLEGHTRWVSSLAFWPDGKTLASASADQSIRLWDLTSRKPRGSLQGHRQEVWQVVLLPDRLTLVSGCKDGSVKLWNTNDVQASRGRIVLTDPILRWDFLPGDNSIVTVDMKGTVARWHGNQYQQKEIILETRTAPTYAAVSSSAQRMAIRLEGGTHQVWDLHKGCKITEFHLPASEALPAAFRDHGQRLLLANWSGDDFHEWDLTTFKQSQSWVAFSAGDPAWALSHDGRWLLAVSQKAETLLRDLETGTMIRWTLPLEEPADVAFSPNGRFVAGVSKRGYVRLWEREQWRELATLRGSMLGLHAVVFSPNSKRLAIGSGGPEAVKLWDLESPQELLTLSGVGSMFYPLAFSPDGNVLSGRDNSRMLHLWTAPSWDQITAAEQAKPGMVGR